MPDVMRTDRTCLPCREPTVFAKYRIKQQAERHGEKRKEYGARRRRRRRRQLEREGDTRQCMRQSFTSCVPQHVGIQRSCFELSTIFSVPVLIYN